MRYLLMKLRSLLLPWRKKHVHDFDMKFVGSSMDYYFECECGKTVNTMNEAIDLQWSSQ